MSNQGKQENERGQVGEKACNIKNQFITESVEAILHKKLNKMRALQDSCKARILYVAHALEYSKEFRQLLDCIKLCIAAVLTVTGTLALCVLGCFPDHSPFSVDMT